MNVPGFSVTISNLVLSSIDITSEGFVAGITGGMAGSSVVELGQPEVVFTNCRVDGVINSNGAKVGGFIGDTGAIFTRCSADVNINGDGNNFGGFAGTNGGTYTDCYASGDIISDTSSYSRTAGGFGSQITGTQTNCYATGLNNWETDASFNVAGFANGGASTDCFWDTEVTTQPLDYSGATGKTTAEMK